MDWRGGTRVIVGAGRIRPFARGVRAVVSIVGCMFFKLFKTGKAADAETPPGDSTAVAEEQGAGAHQSEPAKPEPAKPEPAAKSEVRAVIPVTPLKRAGTALAASELRRCADAASLGFKTTDELEPGSGLIGQERALKAIQFGANIKSSRLQHVRARPAGLGQDHRRQGAPRGPRPPRRQRPTDWVYVYNFENPNRPQGAAASRTGAPRPSQRRWSRPRRAAQRAAGAFESEDYQVRRRAIDEQFRSGQEEALEALNAKAQAQNIAILRTPTGFTMAPMHEGKVVKPEVFNALPEAMRKDVESQDRGAAEGAGKHPGAHARGREGAARAAERAQRGRGQASPSARRSTTCRVPFADVPGALDYLARPAAI